MRFAVLLNAKPNLTFKTGVPRRMGWKYPEGLKVESEYWTQTQAPAVIAVVETDDQRPLMQMSADWDDLFDIEVTPCVTADEGLAAAKELAG